MEMCTQGPDRYYSHFVCLRAAKSRPALPVTEEKIGKVLKTAIKRACGKRKLILWGYRYKYGCGGGLGRILRDSAVRGMVVR